MKNNKIKKKKKIFTFEYPVWILFLLIGGFLLFFVYTIWVHSINHPPRAKSAATKENYSRMVTYITVEMIECNLGETTSMGGNLTCHGRTADSVIAAAVIAKDDVMNAYETDKQAVTSGGTNTSDSDAGYIRLSVSGENIIIKTCHKKPCATNTNQRSETIALQ